MFGRGLAAVGALFVFRRLTFVQSRKAGLLHRRNMHEHVLAASRGLDESKPLGRVKPFHSTFSHHVVSAGLKTIAIGRSLETGLSDGAHDTRYEPRLIAQTISGKLGKMLRFAVISQVLPVPPSFAANSRASAGRQNPGRACDRGFEQ